MKKKLWFMWKIQSVRNIRKLFGFFCTDRGKHLLIKCCFGFNVPLYWLGNYKERKRDEICLGKQWRWFYYLLLISSLPLNNPPVAWVQTSFRFSGRQGRYSLLSCLAINLQEWIHSGRHFLPAWYTFPFISVKPSTALLKFPEEEAPKAEFS